MSRSAKLPQRRACCHRELFRRRQARLASKPRVQAKGAHSADRDPSNARLYDAPSMWHQILGTVATGTGIVQLSCR